jgi:serine O-acetyltransferase
MVGANTVVLSEVEEGSTIVGVQGRIAKKDGSEKITPAFKLNHVDIPDPLAQELCRLVNRIEELENELKECKTKLKEREEK